jgi:hypothetical protein
MVIRPGRFMAVLAAAFALLGISVYVLRVYRGDELAQESVPVLALILGSAAWLTERRLLRVSGSKSASTDSV